MTFDDIMERLLAERSCFDDVGSPPPSTHPLFRWDEEHWRWLNNKRYDVCLIGFSDNPIDLGNGRWREYKDEIGNSIDKRFYAIAPVGAAALIADGLGLWEPAMSTIVGEDVPPETSGTAPYILCIPPEAMRWYPEVRSDLAGIGMRCAFDAREHDGIRWLWLSNESDIENRLLQPSSDLVFAMCEGDGLDSIGIPEIQHRRGFSASINDIVENLGEERCPACGMRGTLMRRYPERYGSHKEFYLLCRECEWRGRWIETGVGDKIVMKSILDGDNIGWELHEWAASTCYEDGSDGEADAREETE